MCMNKRAKSDANKLWFLLQLLGINFVIIKLKWRYYILARIICENNAFKLFFVVSYHIHKWTSRVDHQCTLMHHLFLAYWYKHCRKRSRLDIRSWMRSNRSTENTVHCLRSSSSQPKGLSALCLVSPNRPSSSHYRRSIPIIKHSL